VQAAPAGRASCKRAPTATATMTCPAPDCGKQFEARGKRKYCSDRCRSRAASRAYYARKAERADAAWREQTDRLRQLHAAEGFGAPNGATGEY
jgi:CGNR zinc finger